MNVTTTSLEQFYLIEKEDIFNTGFPENDVLSGSDQIKSRTRKIHRATSLGNIENHKVNILFMDENHQFKRVFTTIWAHTPKNIVLKKGTVIPVRSIIDIIE